MGRQHVRDLLQVTRRQRVLIETLLVLVAAGVIAVVITWPLALHFDTDILGGSGGPSDSMGYWWDIWNNHRNGIDFFGGAVQDQIGVPFGRPIVGSGNLLLLVFTGPAWLLASVASAAFTYNVMALAGLALSAGAMYLLVRWLGLGIAVAAWAGVAMEIAPYEAFRASAHLPLAHMEWAPLLLLAGIAWIRRPTWRRAILLALATLLGWLSNPYYGAMATAVAVTILAVGAFAFLRRPFGIGAALKRLGTAIAALFVLVGIPVLILLKASGGATEAVTRQRVELELYGARVWDYVIPPPGSWIGDGIAGTSGLDPARSPGGERMVFLGWAVIALAIAGLVLAWRRWGALTPKERTGVAVGVAVALVAGLMSAASPTRILGFEFPMPSSLVFDYLPYLRAYARFGDVVLVAVLLLGAIGLALIVRGRSTLWTNAWIAAAFVFTCATLPLTLPLGSGPPLVINGQLPEQVATWQWLRDHDPGATVIEAPAFTSEDVDRYYLGGQTVHGHPLANGGLNEHSAAADFTDEFGNPLSSASAQAYATAGIDLVAIEPWAYALRKIAMPAVSRPPQGYALVANLGEGGGIWRVTAAPSGAIAFPDRTTWDPARVVNGVRWRYMRDSAVMRVFSPNGGRFIVNFTAAGYDPLLTYPLSITAPDGTTHAVPVRGRTPISFTTTLPAGTSRFTLTAKRPANDPLGPGGMTVQTSAWALAQDG